jgi:transketolase
VVAIDGDTKNSTFSERVKEVAPDRFAEGYIAEQNIVGAALGMAERRQDPVRVLVRLLMTRAYDFIRMAAYSRPSHLVLCGSHSGRLDRRGTARRRWRSRTSR